MKILFLTHRALIHQQRSIAAAPPGLEVQMLRDASRAQILAALPGADFLISEREDPIDAGMIAMGTNLRLIQRLGGQTADIDLPAAMAAGIPVCRWPDATCVNVAEHCLMLILALVKKARDLNMVMSAADPTTWTQPPRRSDENTFAYNWSGRSGITSLYGRTMGILGFGEIGRELAQRLAGFETAVLYHKRSRMKPQAEAQLRVTYASEEALVRASDVLIDLLPYTPEGDQAVNASFFARMKTGAFFIFCGGSGGVDEAALLAALRAGHLAGAALDTYTWEPLPPESPLLAAYRNPALNLILTPHVAAGTDPPGHDWMYANVRRLLDGQELLYRVA